MQRLVSFLFLPSHINTCSIVEHGSPLSSLEERSKDVLSSATETHPSIVQNLFSVANQRLRMWTLFLTSWVEVENEADLVSTLQLKEEAKKCKCHQPGSLKIYKN